MSERQNALDFFWGRGCDHMPDFRTAETATFQVNGFHERPMYGKGGIDWFGCSWIDMPEAGAPAPEVGTEILSDICDWRDIVKFPDLDAVDWEEAARIDGADKVDRENRVFRVVIHNGIWERLHCLMGFEDALCALLEEPEEASAYFKAMADYKIDLVNRLVPTYRPDVITYHDDWGTQKGPFFSPETWRELIKPETERIIAAVHAHGVAFELHSCGKYDEIIPEFPAMGINCLNCMDINDIGAALAATEGLSFKPTVHSQEYFTKDQAGLLTEEEVRATVHREFTEWGATGRFAPVLFPGAWYDSVIIDEFALCSQELAARK